MCRQLRISSKVVAVWAGRDFARRNKRVRATLLTVRSTHHILFMFGYRRGARGASVKVVQADARLLASAVLDQKQREFILL